VERKRLLATCALLFATSSVALADDYMDGIAMFKSCTDATSSEIVPRCGEASKFLLKHVGTEPGNRGEMTRYMAASALGKQGMGEILEGDSAEGHSDLRIACVGLRMVVRRASDTDIVSLARRTLAVLTPFLY
jgi:hypothetical protein